VCLEADAPTWIFEAVPDSKFGIAIAFRPIHRLQKKMLEPQVLKGIGPRFSLRIDEFKFVTGYLHKFGSGFWTDADPIDAGWSSYCSVCLNSDLKAKGLDRCQERGVQLQKRLSPGDDDKFSVRMMRTGPVAGPHSVNRRSKVFRGIELSSAIAVGADKIRVAELANRLRSIYFTAGPQIATGKSTKHGSATGLATLALQCVKDLFDGIGHADRSPVI
jgi:hypothetical protein